MFHRDMNKRSHPFHWGTGCKLALLASVVALFFGAALIADQHSTVELMLIVAYYVFPAFLAFVFGRKWIILVCPFAYLCMLLLWEIVPNTDIHPLWYDSGLPGWLMLVFIFMLLPMTISGAIGLFGRHLLKRKRAGFGRRARDRA